MSDKSNSLLLPDKEVCLVVTGSVDAGKCHASGTLILKYDGEIDKVENIRKGDILMGDDSMGRFVLETHEGIGQLYKIILGINNDSYTVNGEHILCLLNGNDELIEISVNDFINLDSNTQSKFKWTKAQEVNFNFPVSETNMEKLLLLNRDYYLCSSLHKIKCHTRFESTITVEKSHIGKYYGFSVNMNHRYLLGDFSIVHNSSFIGVMTNNILDDGKGLARSKVARHPHEVTEGKTSDISTRTIDYNDKKVTLIDLCGHEKYLKTTLFGITGLYPDYGILIVSANRGMLKMTKEHLGILLYLKIPFTVLITRVDITPPNIYEMTVKNLTKILKKYKKKTKFINSLDELSLLHDPAALAIKEKNALSEIDKVTAELKFNPFLTPIISISNKTGYYVNVVKHFLSKLEPRQVWENELKEGTIFYIDAKFTPVGIGLVVSGITRGDTIYAGTEMLLGPFKGEFKRVKVWSIHNNNREVVPSIGDRTRGCLAIKPLDKKDELTPNNIRKGLVIISKNVEQCVCYEFKADVEILNHSSVISPYYTPVIHCGSVRQTAKIIFEENTTLKMGDRKEVSFRFFAHPEFIERGCTFFFREGTTRGVGKVKDILMLKDDPSPVPMEQNKKRRKRQKRLHKFDKSK